MTNLTSAVAGAGVNLSSITGLLGTSTDPSLTAALGGLGSSSSLTTALGGLSPEAMSSLLSNPLPQVSAADIAAAAPLLGGTGDPLNLAGSTSSLAPLLGSGVNLADPASNIILTTLLGADVLGPVSPSTLSQLLGIPEEQVRTFTGLTLGATAFGATSAGTGVALAKAAQRAPLVVPPLRPLQSQLPAVMHAPGMPTVAPVSGSEAGLLPGTTKLPAKAAQPLLGPPPLTSSPPPLIGPLPPSLTSLSPVPPLSSSMVLPIFPDVNQARASSSKAPLLAPSVVPQAAVAPVSVPAPLVTPVVPPVATAPFVQLTDGLAAAASTASEPVPPTPPKPDVRPPSPTPSSTQPSTLVATVPPAEQSTDSPGVNAGGITGLDMLITLSSQEEAAKKKVEVTKPNSQVAPVSGYARASVMSRTIEQKDSKQKEDADAMPVADSDLLFPFGRAIEKKVTLKSAFEFPETKKSTLPDLPKEASSSSLKIYIGNIPRGTTESTIRVECAKHGAVTSMFYNEDPGGSMRGGWAYVTFATPEMAENAVRRMRQQVSLFGAFELLEIRFASASFEAVPPASVMKMEELRQGDDGGRDGGASDDDHDRSRRRRRSRSRHRRRSRGRRRHRDDSDHEGHALSTPGVIPNVVSKKRGLGGFDSATTGGAVNPPNVEANNSGDDRPRQVAARGSWAQFVTPSGSSYYHNITTGERTWEKPLDFDTPPSRRVGDNSLSANETSLFVFHLPPHWGDEELEEAFKPFGQIMRTTVQRGSNGLSRGFGFVAYAKYEEAMVAINAMNGFQVEGKWLKVSLKSYPGAPANLTNGMKGVMPEM